MTVRKSKERAVVPSAERPRARGEEIRPLALRLDTKRGGLVVCNREIVLHDLMQEMHEMNPSDPVRRELGDLSLMRHEMARMVTTPRDYDLVTLASTLTQRIVDLVDTVSGRDALAYMGSRALKLHHIRSSKGAATKREESEERNRQLLEKFDEALEGKGRAAEGGEEYPKVTVSSIAGIMRRKGAFDSEFGERPSEEACYRRILRLLNATGRRVKSRSGDRTLRQSARTE